LINHRLSAWLLAAALSISSAAAQAPLLIVKDAWVRKAPGADVAAVYLSLSNTTTKPVVLVGARSPAAQHVMVHETQVSNGQSQMRHQDTVVIAPGQTVSFSPGGLHVMLSGIKGGMAVGQTVPLVLLLSDGAQVAVAAVVKPLT
jgi:copper(I)-binding protein